MTYILGHCPDEFGLIPDRDGYVKIKEVLKALHEESGWKHIRRRHLDEIRFASAESPIEIKDNVVRAKNRENLPVQIVSHDLPKLLFTCVRRKAHPVVLDKGIFPAGHERVVLSSRREMAERLGRRIDPMPVLLTVHVQKSLEQDIVFYRAGQSIYLADSIPVSCFSGPPLPKQKPKPKKELSPEETLLKKSAGSFPLSLPVEKTYPKHTRSKSGKKEVAWKKDRKNMKKQKQKIWPG